MQARTTPSAPGAPSGTPPGLSRLLRVGAARRRAAQGQQQLGRALAGDFGPGVRADVLAAQHRLAAQDRSAA